MKIGKILLIAASLVISVNVSAQCDQDISLYREYFKQWKAAKFNPQSLNMQMVTSWRNVFINCPKAKQQTYLDGVDIIPYVFLNDKKYEAQREAYIDTLVMVFDNRAMYYPNSKTGSQIGEISGRKGLALQKWAPERTQQIFEALKKAIDLDGENVNIGFVIPYFTQIIKASKENIVEESLILDEYDRLMSIVDAKLSAATEASDDKTIESCNTNKAGLDALVEPYANCEDLIRIYTPKFEAEPENIDLLRKISNMLDKKNCDDSPLYLDVAKNMHKIDPSPESAYLIGKKLLKTNQYAQARPYLVEATQSDNVERAAQAYKYLAQICVVNKTFEQGRDYARKAAALNRNDGEPYIIIGTLYAESAKECGGGDSFYSKVAYWAAVDQFVKAKSIDPSIAEKANKYISAYSQNFPKVEDIFFHGFEEGQEYMVECWINEKTTVRASK